ncbi:PREDICTED: PAB-dependent poly(A)-specific ribonuclease subunit PAN2-like [Priapulus caudatus]|uniref:PAN2-PAN3 deadenylation complex catalytic subunit PAN2 n=1 Tax=Priapulus caudatus TaxID=37621 RepID=A0ABM1DY78_PRICU|nr:PREDICTED: PAB-dependent poly(A)-specific ribonuclease subunit PAN2-like [Priapulus caudatus]XP_014664899.1 PREDICTED: PAB-dependent poly(A)-specific ribonuclease subunit PAN2-like [Priapulus caudatus]
MEFANVFTPTSTEDQLQHVGDMVEEGIPTDEVVVDPSMEEMFDPVNMEFVELRSVLADGGDHYGVSAVSFDLQEELLWMGNQGGHMTSYYGLDLRKYTSFQVHPECHEVRQVVSIDGGVLCLTDNLLQCNARTGMCLFKFTDDRIMSDMQTMALTQPTNLLMGGMQRTMAELDLTTVRVIREFNFAEDCAILRLSNRYACAGSTTGKISLLDPKSLNVEHTLETHSGTLSDFDVSGNLLVTCGYSKRIGTVDRFLNSYDLRMMRMVQVIPVHIDPMFLRFMTTYTTRMVVVSQTGQFNLVEPDPGTPPSFVYQVNTHGGIINFDMSQTCQAMAFGDSTGAVHLFGTSSEDVCYNTFSDDTEFAPTNEPLLPIDIDDMLTPLSTVPMPYTQEKLLSDWPPHLCRKLYRKAPLVDSDVLRTMKVVQFIGYAPNPGTRLRNQVPYRMDKGSKGRQRKRSVPESPLGRGDDPFLAVPKRYRRVEMKYTKLGVDDFDFKHYNKSPFPGLEPILPNSYCNSVLQILAFIEPLSNSLRSHLCSREFCIACETGFLMHMLDTAKPGETCQATNFLRAFKTLPEASGLGLVLNENVDTCKVNYARLIQSWNRFILQQIHNETVKEEPEAALPSELSQGYFDTSGSSIIKDLFNTNVVSTTRCRCEREISRNSSSLLFTLLYPDCQIQGLNKPMQIAFGEVLRSSMCLEHTTQAWCEDCGKYQPTVQSKIVKCLPDVLTVNCQVESQKDFEFWKIQQELRAEAKRNKTEEEKPVLQSGITAAERGPKPCRYANMCTRKDCRFAHEKDKVVEFEDPVDMMGLDDIIAPWVPPGLCLVLDSQRNLCVQELWDDDDSIPSDSSSTTAYYELMGVIAEVHESKLIGSHLVSCVKVGRRYHQRKTGQMRSCWYLFNDFCLSCVNKEEARLFNLDWKVPCVLYFVRKDISKRFQDPVKNPITTDVLLNEASLAKSRGRAISFAPLQPNELPQAGDLVGLDAEFVTLNQEEAELRSDGTRSTIKPSQMSVARVTCVRGQSPQEGMPFIDDYISTQEQVVDYLTKFSGIKPGDLDAQFSNKHLTTLKSTYIKLRHLVDVGIIFVGHGLKKDFRVINLVVPPEQVIDTVQLFHLPRQRMISLKFLAWYFLGVSIQSDMHDSIEDARTALRLHQKYEEMRRDGDDVSTEVKIREMYEKGRALQWKALDGDLDGGIPADILQDM